MNRIRIVSDGYVGGTRIEDADTGELLPNVVSVDWHIDGHGPAARAVVTFAGIEVDLEAEVDE